MNSSPLKDARLRIELDTQDAQARLDALEERMEELADDNDEEEKKLKKSEGQSKQLARVRNEREGRLKPSMDNTGPGKFGLRQIPGVLSAQGLAGLVPGIGGTLSGTIGFERQYGALGEGLSSAASQAFGMSTATRKSVQSQWGPTLFNPFGNLGASLAIKAAGKLTGQEIDQSKILHKTLLEADLRLRTLATTLEKVIEMAKAQVLTGGHINARDLKNFTRTAYEWEFVNARKDQDVRDKTLRAIAEQAPHVIKDLAVQVMSGKFVP